MPNHKDWRENTAGKKVSIAVDLGSEAKEGASEGEPSGGTATVSFVCGQPGYAQWRGEDGSLWGIFSGEVRMHNGIAAHALIHLCITDSGEHYGTAVILPNASVLWDDTPNFDDILFRDYGIDKANGKDEHGLPNGSGYWPYRYRYYNHGDFQDHHVDEETGWSR